jgi:hypothetical protein
VARRLAHGGDPDMERKRFTEPLADVLVRTGPVEFTLHELASRDAITILNVRDRFCDRQVCTIVQGDHSYYFDNNHITNTAAYAISDIFSPLMRTPRAAMATSATLHD